MSHVLCLHQHCWNLSGLCVIVDGLKKLSLPLLNYLNSMVLLSVLHFYLDQTYEMPLWYSQKGVSELQLRPRNGVMWTHHELTLPAGAVG